MCFTEHYDIKVLARRSSYKQSATSNRRSKWDANEEVVQSTCRH